MYKNDQKDQEEECREVNCYIGYGDIIEIVVDNGEEERLLNPLDCPLA